MHRNFATMAALLVTFASGPVSGDSPAPEREYRIVSPDGAYEFVMYPSSRDGDGFRDPRGEARKASADRDATPLWTVTGWYALQTFIADDGRSLVRLGPWASRPPAEELAVAFYRDGVEVHRYSVAELIEDTGSLPRSVSHYTWQARDNAFPTLTSQGEFRLRTLEDRVITFDAATGKILAMSAYSETASGQATLQRCATSRGHKHSDGRAPSGPNDLLATDL